MSVEVIPNPVVVGGGVTSLQNEVVVNLAEVETDSALDVHSVISDATTNSGLAIAKVQKYEVLPMTITV